MATWIDPDFDELLTMDGIAMGEVVASTPQATTLRVARSFAGDDAVGATITIERAEVVGHGHANDTIPVGQNRIVFADRRAAGTYRARTDTSWHYGIDATHANIPVRDPFTRSYIVFDDLAELVPLVRDRTRSPDAFLDRMIASLVATPPAATQPVESHTQVVTLEIIAMLGRATDLPAVIRFAASPFFPIRTSVARALARCGAKAELLALLASEEIPPVQAAIALGLRGLVTPEDRAALVAALPRLHAEDLLLSRNIMNPAMNMLPAPRKTIESIVAAL